MSQAYSRTKQSTSKKKSKMNDGECSICYEEIKNSTSLTLTCNHEFCINCIMQWCSMREEHLCPMCRSKIIINDDDMYVHLITKQIGNKEYAKILLDEFFSYIIESSKRIKKFSRKFSTYGKKYLDKLIDIFLPYILGDFKFTQKFFRTANMMRASERRSFRRRVVDDTACKLIKIANKLY
jgi:hypothetical protein